ncbi:peptidase S8/S53 domain-containing protein [Pilobolus umbonatus]|nr:peptidase S8/S53 domain-containing protein [Pilobolus umbonatus]
MGLSQLNLCVCLLQWVYMISAHHSYILEFSVLPTSFNAMRIRYTFDSDIFQGMAVDFESQDIAEQAIKHPDIIHAWPIHHRMGLQAHMNGYRYHENSKDSGSFFIPENKDTMHTLTGLNYQYKSLNGNGSHIKIGIIDSGVDYTHPALGGCFGQGCKVAYGYDLVGDHFDGSVDSIRESDTPFDNCSRGNNTATGHGTFIAGIIGAEDKVYNWTGVAPGATLGMWRVYSCKHQDTSNDIILKAMEMAYKAGMDIINLSLGVSGGWGNEVLSVVADRLVSKGVHVVAANGNIGPSGIFLSASPATGKDVIAVGSIMNSYVPGYILKVYAEEKLKISYRTFINTPITIRGQLNIVYTPNTFNNLTGACGPFRKNSLNKSIALIHRGDCSDLISLAHARDAGAEAVIFYTNLKDEDAGYLVISHEGLPSGFINNKDALLIISFLDKNKKLKAEFTSELRALPASIRDVNSVAFFSSIGPTNELQLKPELMAVGGNVFSTLPHYLGSYGFLSGTSMATAFVSASIGVLLSVFDNKLNPKEVKEVLMNYAQPVKSPIFTVNYGDSPIRQGAGTIDVIHTVAGYKKLRVLPSKIALNDTSHFNHKGQELTFYNDDKMNDLKIHISHDPSLTAIGYNLLYTNESAPLEPIGLVPHNGSNALLNISETTFTIPAGDVRKIHIHFEPPNNVFRSTKNVFYGGYIVIRDESHTLRASVPYFGMNGDMKSLPILDRFFKPSADVPYTFPSIGLYAQQGLLGRDSSEIFKLKDIDGQIVGGPYVLVRILTGTSLLQIQILKHKKVMGDVPIDESRVWMMRNTLTATEYSSVYYSWNWDGNYVPKDVTLNGNNGLYQPKSIKSGEYQLRVRALRVFGNKHKKEDWDEWISPKLVIISEV